MRVATFIQGGSGNLFCTGFMHEPGRGHKVLIIPPFAEEMNKSRHVLAAISRELEAAGHDVLLPDLYGTGDSEGQFHDATLDIWRADLDAVARFLGAGAMLHLIALRAGALLAADLAGRHPVASMILLHPMANGRQQLNQMLRLRLAGGLTGGGKKETAAELKERLSAGEHIEIAGYDLSPQLAADLEALSLPAAVPNGVEHIRWIELAPEQDRPILPVSQRLIDEWKAGGVRVDCKIVACDQFWATQEIAHCPAIVREAMTTFEG